MSATKKQKIFDRYDGCCAYCGTPLTFTSDTKATAYTLDHILPVARGGTYHTDNLNACCVDCNEAKGAKSIPQFKISIEARLRRLRKKNKLKRNKHWKAILQRYKSPVFFHFETYTKAPEYLECYISMAPISWAVPKPNYLQASTASQDVALERQTKSLE